MVLNRVPFSFAKGKQKVGPEPSFSVHYAYKFLIILYAIKNGPKLNDVWIYWEGMICSTTQGTLVKKIKFGSFFVLKH